MGNVRIAVDATGVGRPVIEMLRPVVGKLDAITLTGGDAVTESEGREYRAPKRDVVAATKVLAPMRAPADRRRPCALPSARRRTAGLRGAHLAGWSRQLRGWARR